MLALSVPTTASADETAVYLHCNGESKWNNFHTVVDGNYVEFNDNAPTQSIQDGAGCFTTDTFFGGTANHNPIYDFPVEGEFTGEIDNITIRYWATELSGSRALNEWTVDIHLQVNGADILKRPTVVESPMTGAGTSEARLFEVTVTNVNLPPDVHFIQLTVYAKFIDGSGILAWQYDSTEYPSGLIFNDATPAATTIIRNG